MRYDSAMTIEEALDVFYKENGFSQEDAGKNYYRINIGPLVTYVYNPESRKKVVHLHDIEHILYEIDTSLEGEAEISAISLASNGYKPWVNYAYGTLGVLTGLLIDRKRIIKGFIKGLKRKSIFEYAKGRDLLSMKVGELRQELGILF